jgi:alpha-beta hydrolase superfamily lysophospholipase
MAELAPSPLPRDQRFMPDTQVERTSFLIPTPAGPRFAWLHQAPGVRPRDAIAVICPPVGPEYTRSHRSVRHLADAIAHSGIPAIRFDYHGTGDSPGSDRDPGRVPAWRSDVEAAIVHARALGRSRVALVGVRLGATLAALASQSQAVDDLVLWNAVMSGRAWVREIRVMASTAESVASSHEGDLEGAGFALSGETVRALEALDLGSSRPRTARILAVHREEARADPAVERWLQAAGLPHTALAAKGWADMVADHQFTQVPLEAIDAIASWLADGTAEDAAARPITVAPEPLALDGIEETACRFGNGGELFGILARPIGAPPSPVLVLFNAGSIHHVGPHRTYVELARDLAAQGLPVFRCDLAGIGDSVAGAATRENHPYPPTATENARACMELLATRFAATAVIPAGLCSGAHTAFHAALGETPTPIPMVLLINPLTFQFIEGMSLETSRRLYDVKGYRRSVRDWRRWIKVLRGEVSLRRPIAASAGQGLEWMGSHLQSLLEWIHPAWAPVLSRRLRALESRGVRLRMIVSEGDPGYDLLTTGAQRAARAGERSGMIEVRFVAGADHTFSRTGPRAEMMATAREILAGFLRPRA